MKVRFWGTRGSIATPGRSTVRYGGNTSCTQVTTNDGNLVVLDCGTGARLLGQSLMQTSKGPVTGHIFLTHTHWDHIQGFPFFSPIFVPGNRFVIYGPAEGERHLEQALAGQMQYTYFPVELEETGATLEFHDLGETEFQILDLHVRTQYMNHPVVTLGYRLESGGRSLVYATDHEPFSPILFGQGTGSHEIDTIVHSGDRRHAEFLRNADLVIHDAQYAVDEYEAHRNWGHSAIDYVVHIALVAGVKRLALYHHDPAHNDAALDRLQDHARQLVDQNGGRLDVLVAAEGDEIQLVERSPTSHGAAQTPAAPMTPGRAHVLVVDDDWMIRDLVRDILLAEDYIIDLAGNGREALSRVDAKTPSLVLLDMRMPEMDGLEVLERLRASERTRDLPVIMLTASDEEDRIQQGFEAGANDYMTKPFTPSQLRARVNGWLSRLASGEMRVG